MNCANPRARQHGNDGLRDHRHVDDDSVAFANACIFYHACSDNHFGQKLSITDVFFCGCYRAVVDQGNLLAAPAVNMSINSIVAGVADAIREPAAIDASTCIKNHLWCFEPINGARCIAPKSQRIALAVRIKRCIAPGVRMRLRMWLNSLFCYDHCVTSDDVFPESIGLRPAVRNRSAYYPFGQHQIELRG